MLTLEQQVEVELYGGLPQEKTVPSQGSGWWIETPVITVPGERELAVLIQGGIHSEYAQLSHKVRRFRRDEFPVICLSQAGAATVDKSDNFYRGGYWRFVERDVAILDTFGVDKVIAYGSSIGAAASITLAATYPERVAAVIAVNPASLIRQLWPVLVLRFARAMRDRVEKDFEPPPTSRITLREAMKELFGGAAKLAASGFALNDIAQVQCPVVILTGRQDSVFQHTKLKPLERYPNVTVKIMEGFIHSDPNSRVQMHRVFEVANKELKDLGLDLAVGEAR